MSDYRIAIPTYKRYDIFKKKTHKLLTDYKLKTKAILFIQNDEDEKAYSEFGIKIVRGPSGYKNIINKITRYFPKGSKYVLMADDIGKFVECLDESLSVVKNLDKIFKNTFLEMEKNRATLGGFYPCPNAYFMCNSKKITNDLRFIYDPLCCIINNKYEVKLDGLNDFERTIEHYKRSGSIIRMNHYSFVSPYNPSGSGGIGQRGQEKLDKEASDFYDKYHEYISKVKQHKRGTYSFILKKKL